MNEPYLIRRHGAFFRPKAQGYTVELGAAGIYPRAEAEKYLGIEGLTIHPLTEYAHRIRSDIAALETNCGRLREMLDQLEQAAA